MKKSKLVFRTAVLIMAAFIVISSLYGCGLKKKPAAQEQATGDAVADASGKPYFMLSALPDIGKYASNTPYGRWYSDYMTEFKPSDKYGDLLMYIGDSHLYKSSEGFEDLSGVFSHYGLMTLDGKIVVDAVYDNAYTQELDNGESIFVLAQFRNNDSPTEDFNDDLTIVAQDGSWAIKLEKYGIFSVSDDRIIVTNSTSIRCYDYNGKLVFSINDNPEMYSYSDGVLVCKRMVDANNENMTESQTGLNPLVPATEPAPTVPKFTLPQATVPTTSAKPITSTKPQTEHTTTVKHEETTTYQATVSPTQPKTETPTTKAPTTARPTTTEKPSPTVSPTTRQMNYDVQKPKVSNMSVTVRPVVKSVATTKVERFVCYDENGQLLPLPQFTSCSAFENGYAAVSLGTGSGVISTNGTWLIVPVYRNVVSVQGKYFIVDDGDTAKIYDENGTVIKTASRSIITDRYYSIENGACSYTSGDNYYNALTDKIVACEENNLPAIEENYARGTFLAKSGTTCWEFDINGKVKKKYTGMTSLPQWDGKFYSCLSGSGNNSETTIYSYSTDKVILKFANEDSKQYVDWQALSENSDYIYIRRSPKDMKNYDGRTCSLFNAKTGQYVFKDCLEIRDQTIGNRVFFCVAREEYVAVYNSQMKMIIKITNSYED